VREKNHREKKKKTKERGRYKHLERERLRWKNACGMKKPTEAEEKIKKEGEKQKYFVVQKHAAMRGGEKKEGALKPEAGSLKKQTRCKKGGKKGIKSKKNKAGVVQKQHPSARKGSQKSTFNASGDKREQRRGEGKTIHK